MTPPVLELLGISKRFGAVRALDEASLSVLPGEIHALLGENGAGKTTLASVAAGLIRAEGGTVRVDGREQSFHDPRGARAAGVVLVPQHDLLVPAATVADNLALLDPRSRAVSTPRARRERVREAERLTGLALGDPGALAEELGVGARQRVGIAAALLDDPRVLILDEPTAVLAPAEAETLFRALRDVARAGRAVVLITHRLPEVFAAADRLTLLAHGRTLLSAAVGDVSSGAVASLLVGESRADPRGAEPAPRAGEPRPRAGAPALEADQLVSAGSAAPPISLALGAGDGVTLLAIDGNGAEEIAAAVAGMRLRDGVVRCAGREVPAGSVAAFRAAGGGFVPGDRLAEGLVPELSIAENLALVGGSRGVLLDPRTLEARAAEAIARFGIRAPGPRALAGGLSGGNQQKLVLARELLAAPRLLVAVHPTRGLDLGAAAEIHRRLAEARAGGAALLVVTADPDEARLLGAPVRVVYRGALSLPLPPDTPGEVLGRLLSGLAA